jgi:hypothetical protein
MKKTKKDFMEMAIANAAMALDQSGNYDTLFACLNEYRQNVEDTCREWNGAQDDYDAAYAAFDKKTGYWDLMQF